jgi:hypothetical protein
MSESRVLFIALLAALATSQCSYGASNPPPQIAQAASSTTPPRALSTLGPPAETPPLPTDSLSSTTSPSPSETATLLTTPSPVAPLADHDWAPRPVLVYFDATGGDGCCSHPFPPGFVLYADGTLFLMQWDQEWFLGTTHLERSEVCQLLNTIDQLGFFDYDGAGYEIDMTNPPVDGSATWQISVSAWREKAVRLYGLGSIIRMLEDPPPVECDYCPPLPTILPALRNTFNLLSSYEPQLQRFESPSLLALWVERPEEVFDASPVEPLPWPLTTYKLDDLQAQTEAIGRWDEPGAFLTGPDARTLFRSFDYAVADFGLPFTQAGRTYQVFAVPVLPGEMGSPYPAVPSSLACSASDGLLPLTETP